MLRDFLEGLIQPSWTALMVGAATTLAVLATVLASVDESFVRRHGYVPVDFDGLTTAGTLELRRTTGGQPLAITTGTSQVGVSINRELLAQALAPTRAHIFKLATPRQPWPDALAIAASIPDGARGVLMIGVSPVRFGTPPDAPDNHAERLGLRTGSTGIYALDNADFLLPRRRVLLRNFLTGRGGTFQDWGMPPPPRPQRLEVLRDMWRQQIRGYPAHAEANRAQLRRLIDDVRARTRVQVLLAEDPTHPAAAPTLGAILADHQAHMQAFARGTGVRYLDVQAHLRLPAEAFRDWFHLGTTDAVARNTELVAGEMRAMLEAAPP